MQANTTYEASVTITILRQHKFYYELTEARELVLYRYRPLRSVISTI